MNKFIPQPLYNKIIKNIPIVCIDVVVKYKEQILLIRRKDQPMKDSWWVVGGRLQIFEDFDVAVKRILKGEAGINISKNNKSVKYVGLASTSFKNSPAKSPMNSINLIFYVEVKSNKVTLDSHSSNYCWLNLEQLKSSKVLAQYLQFCFSLV